MPVFLQVPICFGYAPRWAESLKMGKPPLSMRKSAREFRITRLLRLTRIARGIRLPCVVTSRNRGMKALGATMQQRCRD